MLFKPEPAPSVIGSSRRRAQHKGMSKNSRAKKLCRIMVMQVRLQGLGLRKQQLVPPLTLLRRRRLKPLLNLPLLALGVLKLHFAGTSARAAMPGLDFLPAAASPAVSRPSKRSRPEVGRPKGSAEQQVQELSQQMQKMCQILATHDHSLREKVSSTLTWLLDQNSELAKHLMAYMDSWKQKAQQGQPHPDGPARLTVGAALAKWVLDSPERRAACPQFADAHDKISPINEMKSSIQLAFVKPIKDGRILLKIRPHLQMRDAWTEVSAVLSAADFAETKDMAAPPGPILRSLTKGDK